MAPSSAGCGKFVIVIFLLLFKFCVIILGLAGLVLWRAYSRRRCIQQLERARILAQMEVYTKVVSRKLEVFAWWLISDLK